MNRNFCGMDFANALKCAQPCPGGLDSECPESEKCFADVPCDETVGSETAGSAVPESTVNQNFCGMDFLDAFKCTQPCPFGLDTECEEPQRCFADVTCDGSVQQSILPTDEPSEEPTLEDHDHFPEASNGPISPTINNQCGMDFIDATKCMQPCPDGLDSECDGEQKCFAGVRCEEEVMETAVPSVVPDVGLVDLGSEAVSSQGSERLAENEGGLSGGAIAGIVVGLLVSVGVMATVIFVLVRNFSG